MGIALVAGALGANGEPSAVLTFGSEDEASPWRLQYVQSAWRLRWANSGSFEVLALGSTQMFPGIQCLSFPRGIVAGPAFSRSEPGRRIVNVDAKPTGGFWRRGDCAFHSAPSASTAAGWICITSGQSDADPWKENHNYVAGNVVTPTTPNGFVYQCVQALGKNALSDPDLGDEPAWTTTEGDQFIDNDILWECVGVDTGAVFVPMGELAVGQLTIAMADTDQALTEEQAAARIVLANGTLTADRTLRLPPPISDDFAYARIIRAGVANFDLLVDIVGGAAPVTIAAGTTATIGFDSTGAFRITADA